MDHWGKIQIGGKESGQPWVDAACRLTDSEVSFFVNGAEVLRQPRGEVEFEETGPNVFKLHGTDEPFFFNPANKGAFVVDLSGKEMSTAERVSLASGAKSSSTQARPTKQRGGRLRLWLIIAGVVVVVIILSQLGGSGSGGGGTTSDHGDTVGAFVVCQQFVEDRLVSPATAEYGGTYSQVTTALGGDRYKVETYVDSQNSFGATLRTNFTCVVSHVSGDTYHLESLDFDE